MQKRIQIIIVDDNYTFLEGIQTYLSGYDAYEVVAVFLSGIELLDEIHKYSPDLILMDIEMPGMSGIETAQKLNFYGNNVKMIAISLYNDMVYIKELIESGFCGFVNKNKVSEQLGKVMETALKGKLAFQDIQLK